MYLNMIQVMVSSRWCYYIREDTSSFIGSHAISFWSPKGDWEFPAGDFNPTACQFTAPFKNILVIQHNCWCLLIVIFCLHEHQCKQLLVQELTIFRDENSLVNNIIFPLLCVAFTFPHSNLDYEWLNLPGDCYGYVWLNFTTGASVT